MRRLLAILGLACIALLSDAHVGVARTPFGGGFAPYGVAQPTITSITNQDTGGGAVVVTGTGFSTDKLSFWCNDGYGAQAAPMGFLATSSLTAFSFTATVPPSAAGTYSCFSQNSDGSRAVAISGLTIATTQNCTAVFGANAKAWVRSDTGLTTGSWADKTGNGNTFTGSGGLTVNASSSFFGGDPSVTCDGTSGGYTTGSSVSWGSAEYWVLATYRPTTSSALNYVAEVAGSGGDITLLINGLTPELVSTGGNVTRSAAITTLSGYQSYVGADTTTGSVSVANETPTTGAITAPTSSSTVTLSLCHHNTAFGHIELVEACFVNVKPTLPQLAAYAQYENLRYSLSFPSVPSYGGVQAVTPIYGTVTGAAASGGFRVGLAGAYAGGTVAISGGILSTTSVQFNGSTSVESVVPAGTYTPGLYNVTYTNPDGGSVTAINGFRVVAGSLGASATVDPMLCGGTTTAAWWDGNANYVTCAGGACANGSGASGAVDRSFNVNSLAQPTSADQPTWNSSDVNLGNLPSFSGNATSAYLPTIGNMSLDSSTPAMYVATVARYPSAATGGTNAVFSYNSTNALLYLNGSTAPIFYVTGAVQWGSGLANLSRAVTGQAASGASPATQINVSNSGSPVSGTGGGTLINNAGPGAILASSAGSRFFNSNVAAVAVLNVVPSSTVKACLETWAQTWGVP